MSHKVCTYKERVQKKFPGAVCRRLTPYGHYAVYDAKGTALGSGPTAALAWSNA